MNGYIFVVKCHWGKGNLTNYELFSKLSLFKRLEGHSCLTVKIFKMVLFKGIRYKSKRVYRIEFCISHQKYYECISETFI